MNGVKAQGASLTRMRTRIGAFVLAIIVALSMAAMTPLSAYAAEWSEQAVTENGITIDKTAGGLDENDQTSVTLRIAGQQQNTAADVVFVLDKSTSTSVKNEALAMLEELYKYTSQNSLTVNVGLVTFNNNANNSNYNMDLTELNSSSYSQIQTIFNQEELTSGTNIEAGIRKGTEMLQNDPNALAENKHLVLVTDGVTYLWGAETPMTMYVQFNGADNSTPIWNSNSTAASVVDKEFFNITQQAYVDSFSNPRQWMSDNAKIADVIDEYQTPSGNSSKYVSIENNTGYIANDAAIYMAGKAWQDAGALGYQLYAYASDKYSPAGVALNTEGNYPWAANFIGNLSAISGYSEIFDEDSTSDVSGMFDAVENTILYGIEKGTVTDEIGSDFDLTDISSFKLTVGDSELTGVVSGNTVTFGANNEYVVKYHPATETSAEYFTWVINTPIASGADIKLTYTLELVNKATAAGTYTPPTNEDAILDYTSTEGENDSMEFPVPTVTYTVAEEPVTPVDPGDGDNTNTNNNTQTVNVNTGTDGKASSLPQTSDNTMPFVVGLIALVALAGGAGIVAWRKSH